jgi:UDP:flavonoid glycosyltransferase YjiC (YdhE family)
MADSVAGEGFEMLRAGPATEAAIAEVGRRTGVNMMAQQTPELVAEFFAGARIDLAMDDALPGARAWAPDLVVAEHCDFVGPLVAAVLKVPCAVAAIDPALEPDVLAAIAATVRPRYLAYGVQAPTKAPSGRWLLDLCPPSLQREGVRSSLGRLPMRPEPHQGPEGAPRTPRAAAETGRPRVLVSFSTVPGTGPSLGPVLRALSARDADLVATSSGAESDGFGLAPRVELVTFMPAGRDLRHVPDPWSTAWRT